jgi:hypothetical protein
MSENIKVEKKGILPQVALVLLVLYTISLGVATADEVFHLGIFPTQLERMISKAIDNLKSPDPTVRENARKELELYGDFAVPQLIKVLDDTQIRSDVIGLLKEVSGKDFGEDSNAWRDWYKKHKSEF